MGQFRQGRSKNNISSKLNFPINFFNFTKMIKIINKLFSLFMIFMLMASSLTPSMITIVEAQSATAVKGIKATEVYISEIVYSGNAEEYKVKFEVKGAGKGNLYFNSTLRTIPSRNITLPYTNEVITKCGDTLKMEIGGVTKEVKMPACTAEVSSCINPEGWIEDATKKTENNNFFYVAKDKTTIKYTDTPEKNDREFIGVYCASTARQNFKDVNIQKKLIIT